MTNRDKKSLNRALMYGALMGAAYFAATVVTFWHH